jgi:hypothetical protein
MAPNTFWVLVVCSVCYDIFSSLFNSFLSLHPGRYIYSKPKANGLRGYEAIWEDGEIKLYTGWIFMQKRLIKGNSTSELGTGRFKLYYQSVHSLYDYYDGDFVNYKR